MFESKIFQDGIFKYVESVLPKLPDILEDIREEGRIEDKPIVLKDTGYFMYMMTKMLSPKRILEIGCNIGYSATWLGLAMPENCILDTIDIDLNIAKRAEENFKKAGLSEKIFIHIGKALEVIPNLNNEYDIVFIDAVKGEYKEYLDLILPKLKKGAYIFADNVLWSGRVAKEESYKEDKNTRALDEFNRYFMNHNEIIGTILTIGDGLAFGIKK